MPASLQPVSTTRRRTIRRVLWVIVIILLISLAVWYVGRPKPITVSVIILGSGIVEASVANTRAGTVKACRRAKLAPATGGQIAKLWVRKGDRVESGQLLIELWNDDLAAQVKLANTETASTRASAEEACLIAEDAEREAGRLTRLRAQKLISAEEADRAVTRAQAGQASCRAARGNIDVSRGRVSVARAALERTRLRAPFPGTVAEINGELGEFITPSPTGVATLPAVDLVDNSCIYISAPIDEVDAPAIRPGMEARIRLDAFPQRSFHGRVSRIAPYVLEVEKQARTVEIEALFADPSDYQDLLPGYSADVEVILEARSEVTRVPTEAVLEGYRVLVVNPATQRLEEKRFEAGLTNWKYTEVKSGLASGERVVSSIDRAGVIPGALVRIENANNTQSP